MAHNSRKIRLFVQEDPSLGNKLELRARHERRHYNFASLAAINSFRDANEYLYIMQRAIFATAVAAREGNGQREFNYERRARKRAILRARARPRKDKARSSAISQGMNTEIDSANAMMAECKARLRRISCLSSPDTRYTRLYASVINTN